MSNLEYMSHHTPTSQEGLEADNVRRFNPSRRKTMQAPSEVDELVASLNHPVLRKVLLKAMATAKEAAPAPDNVVQLRDS